MSAYLLNYEHIAALAAFAARKDCVLSGWRGVNRYDSATNCARQLAQANVASVNARYNETETLSDQFFIKKAGECADFYVAFPHHINLTAVELFKMVQCFDYQACEVDNYETTLAARQMNWITNEIIRSLPGYDAAPWGFEGDANNPMDDVNYVGHPIHY